MLSVIMTGYLDREIATRVHEALRDMPVVVLTGLRQCGKSTFLGNDPALKKRRYFSLDRFGDLEAIRTNAEAILGEPGAVTIDEAQRMPGIMEIIKAQVDREGQIPGRFLLSGSANFALLKGVSESLAGRAIYIEMSPFSRREILRLCWNSCWIGRRLRMMPPNCLIRRSVEGQTGGRRIIVVVRSRTHRYPQRQRFPERRCPGVRLPPGGEAHRKDRSPIGGAGRAFSFRIEVAHANSGRLDDDN